MEVDRSGLRKDALAALLLALALSVAWAIGDRTNLAALRLPDTDDVMRLQQVRDWLAGQRFADLVQHRMGDGATPMHWSRLPDLLPAGLVAALTPALGRHAAEIAAVVATPALLLAAALLLVARIARHAGGPATASAAAVIGALAYPATTVFLPGRIDHHGLQLVLLLGACLAVLRPTFARGSIAGALAAASLAIGLETAPLFGALGVGCVLSWVRDGAEEDGRALAGLGLAAAATLLLARVTLAGDGWSYPACDGFDATLWRAALPMALAPAAAVAIAGRAKGRGTRLATASLVAAGAGAAAFALSPGCASPYGGVDASLAAMWLTRVGEAQSPLAAPLATAIGYLGLALAGLLATAWQLRRTPARPWAILLLLQLAALLIAAVQLRGAYAGAMLAAPSLAAAVCAARRRGATATIGAWLASAGLVYPLAADAVAAPAIQRPAGACDIDAALEVLSQRTSGVVVAPIDTGPEGMARTRHRFLAAPYHRNAAGNLAALRAFLGTPDSARTVARSWRADHLLFCPGDLDAFSPNPASLVRALEGHAPPRWLRPVPVLGGALLYRIEP